MGMRRLVAGTTGLTFVLLLVGVYTKEVGADLSCGMRWPLCDGAVFGLFPANFLSFIEWFHRFLALIVVILVFVALYQAWQTYGTGRVTRALAAAAILLPIQALLGALTVLKSALFSPTNRIFIEPLISVAHYGAGVLLLTTLVAATLWAYEDPPNRGPDSLAPDVAQADD